MDYKLHDLFLINFIQNYWVFWNLFIVLYSKTQQILGVIHYRQNSLESIIFLVWIDKHGTPSSYFAANVKRFIIQHYGQYT
jgi:hypothetical protein